MTDALNKLFREIVTNWPGYLAALVALSGLTMSLIQVAKELLLVRRWFHHAQVLVWLHPDRKRRNLWIAMARGQRSDLEEDLLRITASGNRWALYDAELDDVCVQLSAAAQTLVDYPQVAPHLLLKIARNASCDDLRLVLEDESHQSHNAQRRQLVFDARNRVRATAVRSVEMFKLTTGSVWRRGLQVASFALSVVIASVALASANSPASDPRPWAATIGTALIAGFLAPVARDLLAAVEQLRK